jgi:hypothetical protein
MAFLLSLVLAASVSISQTPSKTSLINLDQARIRDYRKIQAARDHLLAVDPFSNPNAQSMLTDPIVQEMKLDQPGGARQVSEALSYEFDRGKLNGYTPLSFEGTDPILDCTIPRTDENGQAKYVTLRAGFKGVNLCVYKVRLISTPIPTANAQPNAPKLETHTQELFIGLLDKQDLQNTIKFEETHSGNRLYSLSCTILDDSAIPVQLYENPRKQVIAVLAKAPPSPLIFPIRPELVLFKNTPDQVTAGFKKGDETGLHREDVTWAVKTNDGIIDLEHVRREAYVGLQKLRDQFLAKYPTAADFPPQMVETPEFKATGLNLESQRDVMILRDALAYEPEGTKMSGYHPIDFAKDKAATFPTATRMSGIIEVKTLKDWFDGKKIFILKIHPEPVDTRLLRDRFVESLVGFVSQPLADYVESVLGKQRRPPPTHPSVDQYIGPMTMESFADFQKSLISQKLTSIKEDAIPLNIYTNAEGKIAFVLAFEPKDLLLLPEQPTVLISTDPMEQVKAAFEPPKDSKVPASQYMTNLIEKLHRVQVDYAIQTG